MVVQMAGSGDSKQKKMVYKANALVEAGYRLTPMEQRILLACIAQVQRTGNAGAAAITDDVMYSVTYADIEALTGHATKTIRQDLRQATLRLKRREVWIRERPNGEGRLDADLVTGWVQSVRLVPGDQRVELRFNKDILPYVTQLQEQFTKFELLDVAHMTSAHAMRIYELLVQWRRKRSRTVPIKWLRSILQLEDRYAAIKDFKKRVIVPAVTQINEHSPLKVEWSQKKTGRCVTHIVFSFHEKEEKMEARLGKPTSPATPEDLPPSPERQTQDRPADRRVRSSKRGKPMSIPRKAGQFDDLVNKNYYEGMQELGVYDDATYMEYRKRQRKIMDEKIARAKALSAEKAAAKNNDGNETDE